MHKGVYIRNCSGRIRRSIERARIRISEGSIGFKLQGLRVVWSLEGMIWEFPIIGDPNIDIVP